MAILGLVYLVVIFIVCFAVVHILKLASVGLKSLKPRTDEKPPEKEQKPAPKSQPVYYIVEKKRAKRSYGQPREISFKDKDA